jgi:peptide-methionine (R)-S-oxide reductase
MTRRQWLGLLSALGVAGATNRTARAADIRASAQRIEPLLLTDAQWRLRLTPEQYHVLRQEGTERAFTSPLNDEKRRGTYYCAGCDLALFTSAMKYDSGTGWPSFFTSLPGVLQTKREFMPVPGLDYAEYHCARCGGHHGHVFHDGPRPTGLRHCNNGVALKFVAEAA